MIPDPDDDDGDDQDQPVAPGKSHNPLPTNNCTVDGGGWGIESTECLKTARNQQ